MVIENIGGAGGMPGHASPKAAPDGYQFVLGNIGTHAQSQTLYKNPPYNAVTDFAPVALIAEQPLVLIARKDFPGDGLQEFIAYAKANQAKMQFGSAGAGSATHLACALLNAAIGVDVTHVPYRGGAPAMQDLIAGRIDYQCPDRCGRDVADRRPASSRRSRCSRKAARRFCRTCPSAHEQGLTDFDVADLDRLVPAQGTPLPSSGSSTTPPWRR